MSASSVQHALALHQAGDLAQAETLYRTILDQEPNDAMALHYLGVIAHQQGRRREAREFMERSIAAARDVPDFHCNLGVLLRDCGRLEEAAAALCQAVRLRPKYPEALSNLGDVLRQQGRLAEAQNVLRQAIALRPSAAALVNLGLVLIDRGQPRQAADALRGAIKLSPRDVSAHKHLGNALRLSGRLAEAMSACRAAVELAPDDADALFGLGNVLWMTGELSEAAEAYRRADRIKPAHPDLLINLAGVLNELGEMEAAIAAGCKAVALRPHSYPARYNLSLALLTVGRLEEGWKLYEARWGCQGFLGKLMALPQPLWDGSDPAGKTIFLRAEQGCGDTIQFSRYVPLLAARGAKVILECQAELQPLLAGLSGASEVIARRQEPGEFDHHLPLLSLPYHFRTTLATIPADVPYLRPGPTRAAAWRDRLAGLDGLKCGLVWAGSSIHRNDRLRSISPAALRPLSAIRGVRFFSLQKEAAALPPLAGLVDLSPDLRDFADTAAALAHLDLLISVDTAVAHLAGAMGRPVWTLLPAVPDWRWMLGTERSPWYPTMRLFRRPEKGDWTSVIQRVAGELAKLARPS